MKKLIFIFLSLFSLSLKPFYNLKPSKYVLQILMQSKTLWRGSNSWILQIQKPGKKIYTSVVLTKNVARSGISAKIINTNKLKENFIKGYFEIQNIENTIHINSQIFETKYIKLDPEKEAKTIKKLRKKFDLENNPKNYNDLQTELTANVKLENDKNNSNQEVIIKANINAKTILPLDLINHYFTKLNS